MKTWLFVPGHEPLKIAKALASGADVVIVDLEDAVPDSEKARAQATIQEMLVAPPRRPRVVVRVNSAGSAYFAQDVASLAELDISGIMLAKANAVADVQALAPQGKPIIPVIESALGIENALQIAQAHPLVERLVLGTMDLIADMGAQWEPDGIALQHIRGRLLMADRAAGLAGPIDGVFPQLGDLEGLHREAVTARKLGYTGKLLLHPRQIEVVHRVFAPTEEEIAQARETIAAFDKAVANGRSAIRIGDRFVDPPIVIWAQNVLRAAREDRDGEETQN